MTACCISRGSIVVMVFLLSSNEVVSARGSPPPPPGPANCRCMTIGGHCTVARVYRLSPSPRCLSSSDNWLNLWSAIGHSSGLGDVTRVIPFLSSGTGDAAGPFGLRKVVVRGGGGVEGRELEGLVGVGLARSWLASGDLRVFPVIFCLWKGLSIVWLDDSLDFLLFTQ